MAKNIVGLVFARQFSFAFYETFLSKKSKSHTPRSCFPNSYDKDALHDVEFQGTEFNNSQGGNTHVDIKMKNLVPSEEYKVYDKSISILKEFEDAAT